MFRLFGLLVLALDLLAWLRLQRFILRCWPERAKRLRWLGWVVFVLLFHPALLMSVGSWRTMRRVQAGLPDELRMAVMAVQVAVILCLVFWGIWGLVRAGARGLRFLSGLRIESTSGSDSARPGDAGSGGAVSEVTGNAESGVVSGVATDVTANAGQCEVTERVPSASPEPPSSSLSSQGSVDLGRRRLLTGAAAAVPTLALGISGAGVAAARQTPVVNRVRLPVRREFTNLHGLLLAQVSDVHVGSYMDAERLDEIRDVINQLDADYHFITGDLLDNHISQLEESRRFVRGLRPRRGQVFMCMGNHEYIAARSASISSIVQGLEEAGAQILVDEARELRIGSDRLWLGGIDYPPRRRRRLLIERPHRTIEQSFELALREMRDDGAPRIVLSHHPRTFVQARELPIDLMLSGHTHGGQIKLGRVGDYALTPVLISDFYHNGLYVHHGRRLYVNAGAGGWLPLRINCPPEITLVELVPA